MIPSTSLGRLHELFSNVAHDEWALFACGILAGMTLWIIFYRRFVKQFFHRLEKRIKKEVLNILAQSAVGAVIIFFNVLLVNHGELNRNFLLAAVGLTGFLFGLWVFIPAEKSSDQRLDS
ncbi:MAG: hypothetical protein HUN04_24590 [Desulfobacter sp.]|nr:MAG: hypothetical protein HUN04_24590 [Desulfobacter sp.]